ncbi:MAG: putative arabinose efflux permease, family, partial [Pseudonocardiales bacterium]|nr:putative arabinose efflux permease, family [Pseudonocardiales bacterium]
MSSTMRVVLGQIGPAVMLPMLVYEIGSGAIMPIVALVALDSGASTAVASLMLAAIGIGTILGDVPAAWLANRLGERRAMIVATLITAGAMFACLVTTSIPALAVALLVLGASTATLMLARQSYVAEAVAVHHRARAMSTLGGVYRIGLFIGPFAGLPVISIWGTRAAFAIPVVTSLIAALILLVAPTPEGSEPNAPDSHQGPVGVSKMFGRHRHLFLTLGVAVASVGLIRAARQAVIPLWAAHIGLSAATISLIFGVANFVDMALFYPSGHVMDKFGRLTVAIPCMVILGITTVAIPLSHGPLALGAIATVMSFGNG